MPQIDKKKQKMLDAAYTHLNNAEIVLVDSGQLPSDANLALINTRVALAAAWTALAREMPS